MRKITFILMLVLLGACSASTDDNNTDIPIKPGIDEDSNVPKTFLEQIPGSYILENKNVQIGADGDIYENAVMLYEYVEETADNNTRAYYTVNGRFVGIEIINTTKTKNIILYKKGRIDTWESTNQVQFTIENIAGTDEEIFNSLIQGINVFYTIPIAISEDGNFTAEGTNYTFHSVNSPIQAVYSVGADEYVGIFVDNGILKMYQENKTIPWSNVDDVSFNPAQHGFSGYPRILFLNAVKNINTFYEQAITISDGNFTAKETNYTFHSINDEKKAVYSVNKTGENKEQFVGMYVDNGVLKMYQENKTTPWTSVNNVGWASALEFAGYPKVWITHSSYNFYGNLVEVHLELNNNNIPYILYSTLESIIELNNLTSTQKPFDTWNTIGNNSEHWLNSSLGSLSLTTDNQGSIYISTKQTRNRGVKIYQEITHIADWTGSAAYQFSVYNNTPYIFTKNLSSSDLDLYSYDGENTTWNIDVPIHSIVPSEGISELTAKKLHILAPNNIYMSYTYRDNNNNYVNAVQHINNPTPLIIGNSSTTVKSDTTIANNMLYAASLESNISIRSTDGTIWNDIAVFNLTQDSTNIVLNQINDIKIKIYNDIIYLTIINNNKPFLYKYENSTWEEIYENAAATKIDIDITSDGRLFLLSDNRNKLEFQEYK